MEKKNYSILEKIDQLGLVLFGESNKDILHSVGPTYQTQVKNAFDIDHPSIGPKYALMKVTNRCNSGCIYCNHSIYSTTPVSQNEPSTQEIKHTIDEVANIGALSINLTGGEPLLRQDLPEIVQYIYEKNLVSILLTNGLILEKRWSEFIPKHLDCMLLTLDSFDPKLYSIQRGADFSHAWAGFESSLKLRDSSPSTSVFVTVTVTRSNLLELPKIVEKLSEYDVPVWFSPYHHYNINEVDENTPSDSKEIEEVINTLLAMQENGYPIANSQTYLKQFGPFFLKSAQLPDWYRCYAGYIGVYIDAELNVRPCWSWSLPVVGNLRKQDLDSIWNSELFYQQRKRIKNLDCSRCWLLCTAEPSIRFLVWGKNQS